MSKRCLQTILPLIPDPSGRPRMISSIFSSSALLFSPPPWPPMQKMLAWLSNDNELERPFGDCGTKADVGCHSCWVMHPGGVRLFDLHGLVVKMWRQSCCEAVVVGPPPRLGWLPNTRDFCSWDSNAWPRPDEVWPVTPLIVTCGGLVRPRGGAIE